MLRILLKFIIIVCLLLTRQVLAEDQCHFKNVGQVRFSMPQMAIPADLPDGTVLYTSPVENVNLSCSLGIIYTSNAFPVTAVTTAAFNALTSQRNGVTVTLYVDGHAIDKQARITLGNFPAGYNPVFNKNINIYIEVRIDKTKGDIPVQGTLLSGGFESVFIIAGNIDYNKPRALISLSTPQITFIPCQMSMVLNPGTVSFGEMSQRDLESGKPFKRPFSVLIHKNHGCTIATSAPFGINMWFDPSGQTLNADGSLDLGNGTGLTIKSSSNAIIPYNTIHEIHDVRVESLLREYFTATVQNVPGQDVRTGPFDAVLVVRMNYF
ncbi:fimbrial protein [Salmonella enterica subsp. enterica serovar Oranienburg]|nr:fimbrial protein [Salmonella enterica subsp. enterica serovar Oranienburg]